MFYAGMASIAAVAITLMAGPVAAQGADQEETGDNAVQVADNNSSETGGRRRVEEIVVTARKKAENLQDVPMAISAFSADGIERRGIDNLSDVAAFTPGLTFSNLFGEFLSVPVIRGVAPTAIFGENNVAVFIDGVFVSGREGINAAQLDLERIEVLKGPQSTRYGRNAFAGAINYVTARPGDELKGEVKINVGNRDKRQGRAMISGPLIPDMLSGRIAVGLDEWSGSYRNELSKLDIGGYQYKTLQSSLWFTPTDTLDVQWAVYLSDDEIDDSARVTIPANCEDRQELELGNAANGFQPIAPSPVADPANPGETRQNPDYSDGPRPQNFCGTVPKLRDNVLAINDQATGEQRELVRSSLHINWDLAWGDITALTGYSKTQQSARSDSNQSPQWSYTAQDGSIVQGPPGTVPFYYTGGNGVDIFPAELTTISTGDTTTEVSQELRFNSPKDKAFRFSVGTYWYNVQADGGFTDFTARLAGGNGQRLPADFTGLFPAPGVVGDAIFGPRFANSPDHPVPEGEVNELFIDNTESWSGFLGTEFDFTDRWSADAGARYSYDTKRKRVKERDLSGNTTAVSIDETRHFDYWTWRVGTKFQVTDTNMIYASIGNGKKSGGMDIINGDLLDPNGGPSTPVNRVTEFGIEKILAYELGNKGEFMEGRGQYDIAVFYNDWTNILMPQIITTDPDTGRAFEQPEGVDLTGGDATTYGAEVNLKLILAENWDIDLGGSWTKAQYENADLKSLRLFPSLWKDSNGDGIGDSASIKGNDLLRQSEWQGNGSLNYERPVFGDWSFYSRTDAFYTGEQWVGPANEAKVPGRFVMNQRLGFETEKMRLEFWVDNLLEDKKPVAAFRDVTFNNTHLQLPAYGGFSDMFPFRMTVSNPKLRTFGVSALMKF